MLEPGTIVSITGVRIKFPPLLATGATYTGGMNTVLAPDEVSVGGEYVGIPSVLINVEGVAEVENVCVKTT
jgi:hypothetical protein